MKTWNFVFKCKQWSNHVFGVLIIIGKSMVLIQLSCLFNFLAVVKQWLIFANGFVWLCHTPEGKAETIWRKCSMPRTDVQCYKSNYSTFT